MQSVILFQLRNLHKNMRTSVVQYLLPGGDPKTRNGGMTERRQITLNPKTRNGGKSPHILKRGTVENHHKS